jgi:hypothetical protein
MYPIESPTQYPGSVDDVGRGRLICASDVAAMASSIEHMVRRSIVFLVLLRVALDPA